jgi:hypothetical protein
MLDNRHDVCCFGFPYQEQVMLQIDERVKGFSEDEVNKLAFACNFLFQIALLKKSRGTVESFLNVYNEVNKTEYSLRANLICSLLQGDPSQFSLLIEKFGELKITSENKIVENYSELWKCLEKLLLPVYFDLNNLRFNGVVFNDNFYFLKYETPDGFQKIVFPWSSPAFRSEENI